MKYFDFVTNWEIYFSIIKSFSAAYTLKELGGQISQYVGINKISNQANLWAFDILIGSFLISLLLEYAVFFKINSSITSSLAYAFPILGGVLFILKQKYFHFFPRAFKKLHLQIDLILLYKVLLILYLILCLAPITNADSLDYHLGVPQTIIENNGLIWPIEWFSFSLFGKGEYLIYFSMLIRAEQLPTLLQFFSLVSVMQLLESKVTPTNQAYIQVIKCILVSTPVLLFLMSSPKPQLIGIAFSCHILYWITSKTLDDFSLKNLAFVCFLALATTTIKLNFFFSIASLIVYFLVSNVSLLMQNYKKLALTFLLVVPMVVVVYFPVLSTKYAVFNNLSVDLFYPISPNWPGAHYFFSYLKNYSDSDFPFPLSILVPSRFGNISMILGFNLVLIIGLCIQTKFHKIFLPIVFLLIISIFAGQQTARFFLEPMMWCGIILAFFAQNKINKKIKTLVAILCLFQASLLLFGVVTLSKGIINLEQRKIVLRNAASGYRLAEWVNSLLDSEAKVLLGHRSMSLFSQKIYSSDWRNYTPKDSKEETFYTDYLKKESLDYVLIIEENPEKSKLYSYCDSLIYGPFEYKTATRNPFNSGATNKAWIYKAKF